MADAGAGGQHAGGRIIRNTNASSPQQATTPCGPSRCYTERIACNLPRKVRPYSAAPNASS